MGWCEGRTFAVLFYAFVCLIIQTESVLEQVKGTGTNPTPIKVIPSLEEIVNTAGNTLLKESKELGVFKSNTNRLLTFNRPEGTPLGVVNIANDKFDNQYGRTFGQYGSYRKHLSWLNSVADDRIRQMFGREDIKFQFPWMIKSVHIPNLHGYGLNGFWNSYAFPEKTSAKDKAPSI